MSFYEKWWILNLNTIFLKFLKKNIAFVYDEILQKLPAFAVDVEKRYSNLYKCMQTK